MHGAILKMYTNDQHLSHGPPANTYIAFFFCDTFFEMTIPAAGAAASSTIHTACLMPNRCEVRQIKSQRNVLDTNDKFIFVRQPKRRQLCLQPLDIKAVA